ncbi:MAG: hypothetical protein M1829_000412 [Trizodia sp. TS-e1964]|nr:MAG: hypothetical protein M1829_000412 [Trizodia sp. TS-e1964]
MLSQAAQQTGRQRLIQQENVEVSDQDGSKMKEDDNDGLRQALRWKSKPCKDYLQQEREFLDLLMIAVHLTGGQPARGPEIGSFKHSNGQTSSRNVYVLNGHLAIITQYDKTIAIRRKTQYVARYLPEDVGQLLVQYMIWVRPFAMAMERQVAPNYNVQPDGSNTNRNEYLWIGSKDPFSDRYVNKLFNKTMRQYLGLSLNISEYRHIAIAIAREFLQPHLSVWGIVPETKATNDNGDDLEEEQEGNMILDLQAAHNTHTAEIANAVDARFPNQLSGRLLRQYLHASISWHEWLGLTVSTSNDSQALAKRSRSESNALQLPLSAIEKRRTSISPLPVQDTVTDADIQAALQKIYGLQAMSQSPAQAKSTQYLATRKPGVSSSTTYSAAIRARLHCKRAGLGVALGPSRLQCKRARICTE